jgi:hypothetical protein
MDFKVGEIAQVGKVRGKVLEIIELEKNKKVKVELADGKIAIVTYIKRDTQALGEMRLG